MIDNKQIANYLSATPNQGYLYIGILNLIYIKGCPIYGPSHIGTNERAKKLFCRNFLGPEKSLGVNVRPPKFPFSF